MAFIHILKVESRPPETYINYTTSLVHIQIKKALSDQKRRIPTMETESRFKNKKIRESKKM